MSPVSIQASISSGGLSAAKEIFVSDLFLWNKRRTLWNWETLAPAHEERGTATLIAEVKKIPVMVDGLFADHGLNLDECPD